MSNSLLPKGSSELEKRVAQSCAPMSELDVSLSKLWDPLSCPVQFLPYLAWAFSVDRWEETWTEENKRQVVSDAFWVHQRKGTVAAVRRVIESLGYSLSLSEWWQVGDLAGTFRLAINLEEVGISEPMINELERIIGDAKPVSRHISQLLLLVKSIGNICIGGAYNDGESINIYPEGYIPDGSIQYDGLFNFDNKINYSGE